MRSTGAEERTIHLRDYLRVAWQGRWMVLAISLIVSALMIVATFLQDPVYRSTATVEIQPRAKSISPAADFSQLGTSSWSWMAEERYINTQLEIVRGRAIAAATLKTLGLETAPRFAEADDPAQALANSISLNITPDTYVLQISIDDTDPQMAQMLANGIARAYIDSNIKAAVGNARGVIDELYTQIEPIKASIAEKEQKRLDLARRNAFFVPDAQTSAMENRLSQLQKELTQIQISRGARDAVFKAIEECERLGESYDSIPLVANDPVIQDLREDAYNLEKQIEELSVSYREGHPKLIAAQNTLAEIPERIELETAKIITKIKTEYAIDERREKDLQSQLRMAREEGLGLSQTESQVETLEAEIKEDRRIYELITARIKEIDLNQQTLVNNIRLLEEAIVPKSPIRPRKIFNLAAGIMLGLFLGLGTVFFIDYLDNTIKTSEDVERFLNLPLLALVPKFQKEQTATVKEAFQTLRTSILFASKGRTLKTLLVTSAGPGEGKSQTIVSLAKTLAQAGDKVVLLDCDLRRPTVHSNLGLKRTRGLTSYLLDVDGGNPVTSYMQDVKGTDNLKALVCGPLPPNPVELFGSARFIELLDHLKERFNWVLLDSPPLASLSDPLVLGSMVDISVVVIKHNQNDKDLIRHSVDQLLKVNANVAGVVLNAVDMKRAGYHDYYYAGYEYQATEETKGGAPSTKAADS